jgi:hypothetical protein
VGAGPILGCDTLVGNQAPAFSRLTKSHLTVAISEVSLKNQAVDENEDEVIQQLLSLEFYKFLSNKEQWDPIEISSSEPEYYSLNCNGKATYLMQIPLKNIRVKKLDKNIMTKPVNYFESFSVKNLGNSAMDKFK